MDYAFSDEQVMFRQSVRDCVEKHYPKERALGLEAQEDYPEELWDDLEGLYGTDAQKQELLPGIAEGRLKFAIAVSEPGGGIDVLGAMRTFADPVDGGWVINGQKIWSTQAPVADYILLLARSDRDAAKKTQGLTSFLVPGKSEGRTTRNIPKIGMRSVASCEIFLDDVFVPQEHVLGGEGQAWYQLLGTLNNERIMVSSLALGALDNMAKIVASDAAVSAADKGIQVFGGMGYSLETQMQRYWRDARLWRIGPITNEMGRNVIAEMAGLPRSF